MEWRTILPFPFPLTYQIVILTILDSSAPLAVFAGYLVARKIFDFLRGALITVSLLAACEIGLMFLWTALPTDFNGGPVRVTCMLTVLTLSIWMAARNGLARRSA